MSDIQKIMQLEDEIRTLKACLKSLVEDAYNEGFYDGHHDIKDEYINTPARLKLNTILR